MKTKSLIAILMVTAISPFVTNSANAGSRYATPPPAVLSPDLTAPWVLQLNNRPAAQPSYGVRRAPARHYKKPRFRVRLAPPVRKTRPVYRKNTPKVIYQPRRVMKPTYVPAYRAPKPATIAVKKSGPQLDARFEPQIVSYSTSKAPGSIIIDTNDKFLYLIMRDGEARRYGVGVGKPGFEWAGTHKVTRKAEWPTWRPPAEMIAREKKKGRNLPSVMVGGPKNPLGARALYLGSTLYRIHGTNSPSTIGRAVSSGCIRMRNEDVMDLYERVGVGTTVTVS